MADVSKIQLPSGDTYDIVDSKSGYIKGMTILSYGSSTWQDFINAYNSNKVVYCRASSNSNPASGSQTRLAFMAYVSNETTPTNVEFQYYRSVSSHTASQQGDQVYVYKLTNAGVWSVTVREASVKVSTTTGNKEIQVSYSNGAITIGHSNTAITAQSTQAVYPITISQYGHITSYGSAITIPTITLNGSSTTSPSFYAPTSAGTSGYYLKSNGSGAPTWAALPSGGISDVTVNGTSVVSGGVAEVDLTGKSDVGHTHTVSNITDFPTLATVATTGDYDDLIDKPSDYTYSTTSANGVHGFVPAPLKQTTPTDRFQLLTSQSGWQTAVMDATVVSNGPNTGKVKVSLYARDNGWSSNNYEIAAVLPDATTTSSGTMSAADKTKLNNAQEALVSGTNIKTINNNSILGSGDITIGGDALYDYTSSWSSPSLSSNSSVGRMIYGDISSLTPTDFTKIRAYIANNNDWYYQLQVYAVKLRSGNIDVWVRNCNTAAVSGTLYFVLPFEATSDSAAM